jgi:hypothetical protein
VKQLVGIIDEDSSRRGEITRLLEKYGEKVRSFPSFLTFALESEPYSLLIVSEGTDGFSGERNLEFFSELEGNTPVLFLSHSLSQFDLEQLSNRTFIVLEDPIDDERFFRAYSFTKRLSRAGFQTSVDTLSGDLRVLSLLDLLQFFLSLRKSGKFTLHFGEEEAQVVLREGDVIGASIKDLSGEIALSQIVHHAQSGGGFVFTASDTSAFLKEISKRTDHLLLEFASSLDEGR